MSVSIDGVAVGDAAYGGTRTDVCDKFPGRAGCPNVGWNFIFDTTRTANGNHKVEVMATTSTGRHATASSSFSVANTTAGMPLKMYIDDPGAQNATVTGFTTFAGWAIDDNGPITSVVISIDGAPRGTVVDTVSRPDVCAAFPGRAGCPIAGWTFSVDTTLIPDGRHTLAVTGNSSTGDQLTVSASFTVANWTSGNPMRISIDNPNSQSGAFSGIAGFGGWAISDIAAITTVAISIDGVAVGNARYGAGRPDVCRVFPGRAGCPDVGWNFSVDTTALANGNHTLEVTATSNGGQSATTTANFTVSNSSPILIDIDVPSPQNGSLNGVVSVSGWAIDTSGGVGIASVQILVDGVFQGNASYGTSRPDVCAVTALAAAVGCPNVGWSYSLDTTVLASSGHILEVRAISTAGQQATQSSPFRVTAGFLL